MNFFADKCQSMESQTQAHPSRLHHPHIRPHGKVQPARPQRRQSPHPPRRWDGVHPHGQAYHVTPQVSDILVTEGNFILRRENLQHIKAIERPEARLPLLLQQDRRRHHVEGATGEVRLRAPRRVRGAPRPLSGGRAVGVGGGARQDQQGDARGVPREERRGQEPRMRLWPKSLR